MSQLTNEQQQALFLDRNISVTAGAGAGKTRLLVERFLKIAIDHYRGHPHKVRRILAITFTNKAAGEMKERISEAINTRIRQAEDAALRNHLLSLRDQLNSVAISTIHAFCAKILREYPIEAGLPPDFGELDEMQSLLLIGEATDDVLKELEQINDETEREKYWFLFQLAERRTVTHALHRALTQPFEMEQVLQRFESLDEESFLAFLTDLWLDEMRALLPAEILRNISEAVEAVLRVAVPTGKEAVPELWEMLQACDNLPDVQALSVAQFECLRNLADRLTTNKRTAYSTLNRLGGKKAWPAAGAALLHLSSVLADWYGLLKDLDPGPPPGESDRRFYRWFKVFLTLYKQARARYEQKKSEVPAVDFEDLLLRTYHLLRNHPEVRSELSARYEFIMVDEFQDTNALQWKIIELLAGQNEKLASNKLFIVGDPKQSIYGFRSADIRIFRQVKQAMARAGGSDDLQTFPGNVSLKNSFRFVPDLNAFINDLFAFVLHPTPANAYEVEFQQLTAMREVPAGSAHIELALFSEEDEESPSEETYIAATIERLVRQKATCYEWQDGREVERPLEFGDIAILIRSRNNLLAIEQALRDRGIPFKTVKGIGYWQQQEIYDFYHLLRFLADPDEDMALVGILRSKLLMVPDDVLYFLSREEGSSFWQKLNGKLDKGEYTPAERQKLEQIRAMLQRWIQFRDFLPLNELLEKVLNDLRYPTLILSQVNGEQMLANIEKFIEHVYRFGGGGVLGLIDLIWQVELLIEKSMREGEPQINQEDRTTVKLMTIHAAKGLQFPVVFIPYLNTKNKRARADGLYLDAELGLAVPLRQEALPPDTEFTLHRLLKLRQFKKDLAEAKRVFYVGVTRASNHLFLSAKIKRQVEVHSALQWVTDFFARHNTDPFDAETEQFEGSAYRVRFVRSLQEEASENTETIRTFLQGLEQLQARLKNPLPVSAEQLQMYQALSERPGPITFSATRLMTYKKDPEEYYRRYHLGFFESDYELFADAIYRSNDSLIKGKIVHRFLELMTEHPTEEQALIERVLYDYEVYDPQKRAQFAQEILKLKEKVLASPVGRKIVRARVARNEIPITMRLGNDFFTGTIDRLIQDENGLWRVVDYKTNRIPRERIKAAGQEYDWQMKGYALLLSRIVPEQSVFPVDLYFIYPDALYSYQYSTDEIREIEEMFRQVIEEIKEKFPLVSS